MREITIRKIDLVNINVPHLMKPLSMQVQKMVGTYLRYRNCGLASLSVTLNKNGYCPGEFIVFNVKIETRVLSKLILFLHP